MNRATIEKIKGLLKQADDVAAKAVAEDRDLTDEERGTITAHFESAKKLRGDADLLKAVADLGDGIGMLEPSEGSPLAGMLTGKGTLGDRFTSHSEFKGWLKQVAPNGNVPEKARVQSPPLGFKGLKELRTKALVTGVSDTSAGALVDIDSRGLLDTGTWERPLTVFDLITRGTTTSDVVDFVRVTSITNAAAPVPEATTAGEIPDPDADNTAGVKPESSLVLARVSTPVITIAHWIPATKRALSDAGQIRTLIDNFLRYGLEEELEDQIVTGDGSDENFTGILETANIQAQAWDTDLLTTTRKAKTKVRVVGRATATAYLFHPNDAERLDLLKDLEGRFYFGGPGEDGVQRLWRLPVVETEAMPEGTGLVADFRQAVLWDREQASISVTDSHADFFIRNLVAILAELRAAFGVIRPAAFVEIDLSAAS